ncbi:MAG: sodium/proton-translocating pyrophosphatase, partial [Candidatus Bathyarchaeia archaeon]
MMGSFEAVLLYIVVGVACGAIAYAGWLARQILREAAGTGRMFQVWTGISEGANAYLRKQFRSILIVIAVLALILYLSSVVVGGPPSISLGRALAFLMGVTFSGLVGYLGMNMAVKGNIRVAEAARR